MGIHTEIGFETADGKVVLVNSAEFIHRHFCRIRRIKQIGSNKIQLMELQEICIKYIVNYRFIPDFIRE